MYKMTSKDILLQRVNGNAFYSNLKRKVEALYSSLNDRFSGAIERNMLPMELTNSTGGRKGGRFMNTPLPLLPSIRKAEVEVGKANPWLSLFGINSKIDTKVKLWEGANKKSNRYLRYRYLRMLKCIGAKKDEDLNKIVWNVNLHEIDIKKLTRKQRKKLNADNRKYWNIALSLLIKSTSYRMCILGKVAGKIDRWYHRDYTVYRLKKLNASYNKIVSRNWQQQVSFVRRWIEPTPGKWRPLSLSSLASRMYTGGLNILLEVFVTGGWYESQHAYKSFRGTQTVWRIILGKIIRQEKNIYEYDLKGFFNTVRLESVSRALRAYKVPKFMVVHMLMLSRNDIEPISVGQMLAYCKDGEGWLAAHKKYETIHMFRRGWRSTGVPQGFGLAPVLAVLPLIVFRELEKYGVKSLMFSDDGLLYGNGLPDEPLGWVSKKLGLEHLGIKFSHEKSGWVKKDGVWLKPLKFVGLKYNPFKDVLQASTRSGSALPLEINLISITRNMDQSDHEDYGGLQLAGDLGTIKENDYEVMVANCKKYYDKDNELSALETTSEYRSDLGISYDEKLSDVVANKARFKEIDQKFGLMDSWAADCDAMRIQELAELKVNYEMMSEFETVLPSIEKRAEALKIRKPAAAFLHGASLEDMVVEHVLWYKKFLRAIDEEKNVTNIDTNFSYEPTFPFGILIKHRSLNDRHKFMLDKLKYTYGWYLTFAYMRLSYENTYDQKMFGSLIARLFAGSFAREDGKRQDFRLGSKRGSLIRLLRSWIGNLRMEEALGDKLTTFNSTSVCSFMVKGLMDSWDKEIDSNSLNLRDSRRVAYKALLKKLAQRRCSLRLKNPYLVAHGGMCIDGFTAEERSLIFRVPLCPANYSKPKNSYKSATLAKVKKLSSGLSWDAIHFSVYSESDRLLDAYIRGRKQASTDWFTWARHSQVRKKVKTREEMARRQEAKRKLEIKWGAKPNFRMRYKSLVNSDGWVVTRIAKA